MIAAELSESGNTLSLARDEDNYVAGGMEDAYDMEGPDAPGKVNDYRFKTFYLGGDKDNYKALVGQGGDLPVIDPDWLKGNDPNAVALSEALLQQSSPCNRPSTRRVSRCSWPMPRISSLCRSWCRGCVQAHCPPSMAVDIFSSNRPITWCRRVC